MKKMQLFLNRDIRDAYYKRGIKLMGYEGKMSIKDVDFSAPWWMILWIHKWHILGILLGQGVIVAGTTLMPMLLSYALREQSTFLIVCIIVGIIAIIHAGHFLIWLTAIVELQVSQSVYVHAISKILTTDPIYHSTKSTGKIISKIQRGSDAYTIMLDIVLSELINVIVGFVSLVVVFMAYSVWMGTLLILFLFFLTMVSIWLSIFHSLSYQPHNIELEDTINHVGTESVHQALYIRSTFATDDQLSELKRITTEAMPRIGSGWHLQGKIYNLILTLYYLSVLVVALYALNSMRSGQFDIVTALALISSYLIGTQHISFVGFMINRVSLSYFAIHDMWQFVRDFGVQTYPVLTVDSKSKSNSVTQ